MRIGILTGGGDVPGLNPCIKAVVYNAVERGWHVVGIRRGWAGLLDLDPDDPGNVATNTLELHKYNTRTIDRSGGTFLHSNRTNPGNVGRDGEARDCTPRVLGNVERLGLDVLIPIGGDDTLSYSERISREGPRGSSSELPTRTLGRTGLQVTQLGYGAMELRGKPRGPAVADGHAQQVLRAVVDGGMNYIDMSIDYGFSEERIGAALAGRRNEFYLASKCGCVVDQRPGERGSRLQSGQRRGRRRAELEAAAHRPPGRGSVSCQSIPIDPGAGGCGLDALLELQRQGKVRFVGISGTLPNLPEQIRTGVFDVFQIPYSALQPEHEQLISDAAGAGGGTVIRGGVAKGALATDKPGAHPHHDRRHGQHRAPRRYPGHGSPRTAAARRVFRS